MGIDKSFPYKLLEEPVGIPIEIISKKRLIFFRAVRN